MLRACILTAFLVAVVTAQANDTAYWSARYGGWSKEPACGRGSSNDVNFRRCWVLTLGKDQWGNEAADISYLCSTEGFEIISFGTTPYKTIDVDDPALRVKWDYRHEERIATWVQRGTGESKSLWYNISEPGPFIAKMDEHETLALYMPIKHERDSRVTFPLKGAVRSIASAMRECGITRSKLANVLNQ